MYCNLSLYMYIQRWLLFMRCVAVWRCDVSFDEAFDTNCIYLDILMIRVYGWLRLDYYCIFLIGIQLQVTLLCSHLCLSHRTNFGYSITEEKKTEERNDSQDEERKVHQSLFMICCRLNEIWCLKRLRIRINLQRASYDSWCLRVTSTDFGIYSLGWCIEGVVWFGVCRL